MNLTSRNRQLDILRAAAILLVLGRHLPEGTTPLSVPLISVLRMWYQIGWSGVDLFFVLSGFLVSGLLFDEYRRTGWLDIGRFFIRRGLRIFPGFYLMIFVSLIFVWHRIRPIQFFIEIAFLQSYSRIRTMWMHTWTLAIEEHFYLMLGVLFLLLSRQKQPNPFRLIPALWGLAAIGCLLARVMTPYDSPAVFIPTHKRIDALLFGVFLSYLYRFHHEALVSWARRRRWFLAAAAAGCLYPIFVLHLGVEPYLTRFGLTGSYLGYGAILLIGVTLRLPETAGTAERILKFIGTRSYSIYLWHFPWMSLVAQPIATRLGGAGGLWTGILVYLIGSVAVGALSYRWIEKPILAFRDRRFPNKTLAN